jgi:hypothetical protein
MPNAEIIAFLNLLSAVVALLISYYAYKNNKLVDSILLRYISVGFLLLGISLLMQAGTERLGELTPVDAVRVKGIELYAFLAYTAIQLLAYGVFAWGYGLSAFANSRAPKVAAASPLVSALATTHVIAYAVFILAVYISSQVGVIVLLLLIVIQGVRVFSSTKSNLALIVLFGFILIFAGHLLMLGGVLGAQGAVYLAGNSIEFCGFLSLLFFLFWSGRTVR